MLSVVSVVVVACDAVKAAESVLCVALSVDAVDVVAMLFATLRAKTTLLDLLVYCVKNTSFLILTPPPFVIYIIVFNVLNLVRRGIHLFRQRARLTPPSLQQERYTKR